MTIQSDYLEYLGTMKLVDGRTDRFWARPSQRSLVQKDFIHIKHEPKSIWIHLIHGFILCPPLDPTLNVIHSRVSSGPDTEFMMKNKFSSLFWTKLACALQLLSSCSLPHQFIFPFLTSAANISFGWDVEGSLISSSSRLLIQSALTSALT